MWFTVQEVLFPFLEAKFEAPLTEKLKKLVVALELVRIEEHVFIPFHWRGQSPKNRKEIARAFVGKAVYNLSTTRELIDRLETTPALRRVCGWEKASEIPHESSFSRAFAEFAQNGLGQAVHESLIKQHVEEKVVGHISRDSTAIEAREKPRKKNSSKNSEGSKEKRKRGRPKKGEQREKVLTRLERQQSMTKEKMLEELPKDCDVGTKKNSKGYKERSNVERVNGRLKDEFGGKMVRVRGNAKIMAHLMFGIIALTADQLIRFVT